MLETFTKNRKMLIERSPKSLRFIFISSCCEYWGGSEDLWSETARYLSRHGFKVASFKNSVRNDHRIKQLRADGIKVRDIHILILFLRKFSFFLEKNIPFLINLKAFYLKISNWFTKERNSTLFVISQGENFDGVEIAKVCIQFDLPYVIISQKASDSVWVLSGAEKSEKRY